MLLHRVVRGGLFVIVIFVIGVCCYCWFLTFVIGVCFVLGMSADWTYGHFVVLESSFRWWGVNLYCGLWFAGRLDILFCTFYASLLQFLIVRWECFTPSHFWLLADVFVSL